MTQARFPRLHPAQVCFVVEDVATAVEECVASFGWGPFHRFTAPVPEARYHDWTGSKKTDVALGMAGGVQVELIHVHEGHDTVEAYQARYGAGLQHLGISCRDREQALAALEEIGGSVDDQGEYPGIRFAFVDTPTGPGMFELLQATGDTPPPGADSGSGESRAPNAGALPPSVELDRATIVTDDLDRALAFYARAFRWEDTRIEACTLRVGSAESRVRRTRGQAGQLLLELVEPQRGGDDPYARHLARGDHGLVHAGGLTQGNDLPVGATVEGEWLEDGEVFALYAWSGGPESLQFRRAST
jgi:catechol 2,3-dioxygenase-like lactoylglutathione lyase family enzyme